jgi:colicin import membrane protein
MIDRDVRLTTGDDMGREAKITYEQVAAAADAMCAANLRPSSRTVRERLGNTGSMGTINRLLQEWKATQERHVMQPLTLPPVLQRAILDFMAQELAQSKGQLESSLAEQRDEMAELAIENERQGADIEERINSEVTLRAELATLQGRIAQTESELSNARRETVAEREEAAKARVDLAKALLRLEAMPRLEADLAALRDELKSERQDGTAATQLAAVLEAKLEAARERAAQAEMIAAEARAAVSQKDGSRRDSGRGNGSERRTQPEKNA